MKTVYEFSICDSPYKDVSLVLDQAYLRVAKLIEEGRLNGAVEDYVVIFDRVGEGQNMAKYWLRVVEV